MEQIAVTLMAHPTLSLVSLGGATTVVQYLAPVLKVGAGRAVVLALTSRFSRAAQSVRTQDMARISFAVETLLHDRKLAETQRYVLIVGEKGIGKSTALQAAIGKKYGVLKVTVMPGDSCATIIDQVLATFTNAPTIASKAAIAKRMMFFYQLFFARPIAILEATEVEAGQKPSEVLAAARILTQRGFVVVIDSSPNSLPSYSNLRNHTIDMEALPWAQTLEIPELAPLVSTLESAGMLRHVEFIIGTNLALLIELQARLQAAHENPVEVCWLE
eukprot:TRINITY_DN1877_c1_g1_i4.p1 TRINITY_DN1877_c1_g1~~TRINITY_DN1877_c1_g1_i4.p1  ORF type:complete len:274 (-),score=31.32 TRINITY_DN1877_c1_g1_i4:28-849(-)